eukprot:sb/3463343/
MRGNLFRVFLIGGFVCLCLISILQIFNQRTLTETLSLAIPFEEEAYYADDVASYKNRIVKEYEFKTFVRDLTSEKRENLSLTFHRNLTIHYAQRSLLPPSLPLFHEQCLGYLEKPFNQTVSIVLVFYNEAPPLLMRTLTTIVHRTLPRYLTEIIVIDDGSDVDISEEVMEYSTTQRIPVKWLKNDYNIGIARSRMKGIEMALGDTIALLDSHMEIADLWLEPLLDIISSKPLAVAIPNIIMMDEKKLNEPIIPATYIIQATNAFEVIKFGYPEKPIIHPWESRPSSALLGGGIVAYKSTLQRFYPIPLMSTKKWGVENNRLSYRAWMCGDGVFMSDCSQVVHPQGSDPGLLRYSQNSNTFWTSLVAEAMAELLNFIPKERDRKAILSKYTDAEELIQTTVNMSKEVAADFDYSSCPRDYDFYRYEVFENYNSFESDQYKLMGEVSSLRYPERCLDVVENDRVILYQCRGRPLNSVDRHLIGFSKLPRRYSRNFTKLRRVLIDPGAPVKVFGCHTNHPVRGTPGTTQRFDFNETEQWIVNADPGSPRCVTAINEAEIGLFPCETGNVNQKWTIKLAPWFHIN